jgi:hypothetical protein
MRKRTEKARRAAMVASTIAIATSFGLTGAGMASAAAPLTIKPFSIWTLEVRGAACENVQFDRGHVFVSDLYGDAGSWSGGNSTIALTWTSGVDVGVTFRGRLVSATKPVEYKGPFGGVFAGNHGKLIKGVVAQFDGYRC